MARAIASIEEIEGFKSLIFNKSESILQEIESLIAEIESWIDQIESDSKWCTGLCSACSEKASEFQSTIAELDTQISRLEGRLASTEPYIEETETDEDGNETVTKKPNPEYKALQAKIATLREKRNKYQDKIARLQSIASSAAADGSRLDRASEQLREIIEELCAVLTRVTDDTEEAARTLIEAVEALNNYLAVVLTGASQSAGASGTGANTQGNSSTANTKPLTAGGALLASLKGKSDEEKLEAIQNAMKAKGLVKRPNLKGFDPQVAADAYDALLDAKKDFPNLTIDFIGTIQTQAEGFYTDAVNSYFKSYTKAGDSPLVAKARAEKKALAIRDTITRCESDSCAISVPSMGVDGATCMGIGIQTDYAADHSAYTSTASRLVASKSSPIGCSTVKSIVDHEIGHEIDRMVDARNDKKIEKMYNQLISKPDAANHLSSYATTQVGEFIAEGYAEYRNNPNPRPFARAVYKRLIKLSKF